MNNFRVDDGGRLGQTNLSQAAQSAVARGSFEGAKVQLLDQKSLVADAAEELTAALSEEKEKELAKREIEAGRKTDSFVRVMKVQKIAEMLEKLSDLDRRDLLSGLKALLQRQGRGAAQYREEAAGRFKHPAHQYTLLSALVETLEQRAASPEDVAEAQEALEDLLAEHGSEIRAAVNISSATKEYSKRDLGNQMELREIYESTTSDFTDMSSVVKTLAEQHGDKDIRTAIEFMIRAIGLDLSAGSIG